MWKVEVILCLIGAVVGVLSSNIEDKEFYKNLITRSNYRDYEPDQMRMYRNELLNPCDNFYEYACNNWGHQHPLGPDEDRKNLDSIMSNNLRYLIESALDSSSGSHEKLRDVYFTCMNPENASDLTGAKNTLRWILDNESRWSWQEYVGLLMKMGANVFFKSEIEYNPNEVDFVSFDIMIDSQPDDPKDVTQFLKHIQDLKIKYKNENFIQKVWEFHQEYMKLSSLTDQGADIFGTLEEISAQIPKLMFPEIVFHTYMFREENGYQYQVKNVPLIKELITLNEHTDSDVVNFYLVYKATIIFRSYLNNTNSRQDFCIDFIIKYMEPAVILLLKDVYDSQFFIPWLSLMEDFITEAFQSFINKSKFFEESDKIKMLEDLEKDILVVGSLRSYRNPVLVGQLFADLLIHKESFLRNVIKLNTFAGNRLGLRLLDVGEPVPMLSLLQTWKSGRFKNMVIVPLMHTIAPWYFPGSTKFVTFGKTGASLSRAIAEKFQFTAMFDDENELIGNWSDSVKDQLYERFQCYYPEYSYKNVSLNRSNMRPLIDDIFTQTLGLEAALEGYRSAVAYVNKTELENGDFEMLALDNYQLFFLAYAQSFCEVATDDHIFINLEGSNVIQEMYVNEVVTRLKEFYSTFKCPVTRKTCEFF